MLKDSPKEVEVISREVKYRGKIWDIVRDVIVLPDSVVTTTSRASAACAAYRSSRSAERAIEFQRSAVFPEGE